MAGQRRGEQHRKWSAVVVGQRWEAAVGFELGGSLRQVGGGRLGQLEGDSTEAEAAEAVGQGQ